MSTPLRLGDFEMPAPTSSFVESFSLRQQRQTGELAAPLQFERRSNRQRWQAAARIAEALRFSERGPQSYLAALADLFERTLPAQTQVKRLSGLWPLPRRVTRLSITLWGRHYHLSIDSHDNLIATTAVVRVDAITSIDHLNLETWIDLLSYDLATYARSSAVGRRSLALLTAA